MLPSSPPVRAWKPEVSFADSQYSINLDGLDGDAHSDDSTGIPHPKVDRIFSEDIDGPSDFTQNMGDWLRGGTMRKSTVNGLKKQMDLIARARESQNSNQAHARVDSRDNDEDSPENVENEHDDNDDHIDQNNVDENDDDDNHTMSNHTPTDTPPRISVSQRTPIIDSSEWEPHGITSTPFPRPRPNLLQPTVEEYQSEISPARSISRHGPPSPPLGSSFIKSPQPPQNDALQHSHSRGYFPAGSEKSLEDDAEEDEAEGDEAEEDATADYHEEDSIMNPLYNKYQQLEQFNDLLQSELSDERKLRGEDSLTHKSQLQEATRREEDLRESIRVLQLENEEQKQDHENVKIQLRSRMDELADMKFNQASDGQDSNLRIQQMQAEMDQLTSKHAEELQALRRELETARRKHNDSNEDARASRKELDEARETHEDELNRLRLELQNAREDESATAELEQQLVITKGELAAALTAATEVQNELEQLQLQFSSAKQVHSEELVQQTQERTRAVELATTFQQQIQDLRRQLREDKESHDRDLTALQANQSENSTTSRQEIDLLHQAHESRITELNEAVLDRDEARDALHSANLDLSQARAELTTAQRALADIQAVNATLDVRVAEASQRREKAWRDKYEALERERQVMAKALLHQWGREEAGIQEPQLYAFKYKERKDRDNTIGNQKSG
jgi:hypothetical protein